MSASTWYVITAKCNPWVDIFPRYPSSASIFIGQQRKVSTIPYSLFLNLEDREEYPFHSSHDLSTACSVLSIMSFFMWSSHTSHSATQRTLSFSPSWEISAARGWGLELSTEVSQYAEYFCFNTYKSIRSICCLQQTSLPFLAAKAAL